MEITLLDQDQLNLDIEKQITLLYTQLNAKGKQCDVSKVLDADNKVIIVICKENNKVIGMALMATYKVISGHRGLIEDVVVDNAQRGKGIGRKLMEKLLAEGKKLSLNEVLLFTGHHRAPAIALYASLGFTLRESGLYNLKLN